MKLATFDTGTERHIGVIDGDQVIDLTAADPSLASMLDLLNRGAQETASNGFDSAPRLNDPRGRISAAVHPLGYRRLVQRAGPV
jgi:hypothetical protein